MRGPWWLVQQGPLGGWPQQLLGWTNEQTINVPVTETLPLQCSARTALHVCVCGITRILHQHEACVWWQAVCMQRHRAVSAPHTVYTSVDVCTRMYVSSGMINPSTKIRRWAHYSTSFPTLFCSHSLPFCLHTSYLCLQSLLHHHHGSHCHGDMVTI